MNGFFTVNYKNLFFDISFQFWSWLCKRFDLQTVLHTQMSHGLRSKECAGHRLLLIILSANTPLRAPMNALAIQTVVEYCWNNVQQQFIGQQLGKLVKYLIHVLQNWPCPQGNQSHYSVSTHIKLHNSFGMMLWNFTYLSVLTLILRRSRMGTVWFYTSTSNKRAAWPKLYTKSLTRDLKLMYSHFTLVRISINL